MTAAGTISLVGSERSSAADQAGRWLSDPALRAVLEAFGGPTPDPQDPASVAAVAAWTARHWDFRRGAERRAADRPVLAAPLVGALVRAADALGLMATPPPARGSYDATVVLGGAVTGNQLRAGLARRLHDDGVDLGLVVGLTADRPLSSDELASDPAAATDGQEPAHLRRALAEVLGGAVDFELLVAPARASGRRPDTALAVAHLCAVLPAADRAAVLLVTSAIYAPYQFFVAAPVLLSSGTSHAGTVGTATSANDPAVLAPRLAQELHSCLHAAARLLSGA